MLCTTLSKLRSKPSLSGFITTACQVDVCCLGPRDTVSIDFKCEIEILRAHYRAFLLNSEFRRVKKTFVGRVRSWPGVVFPDTLYSYHIVLLLLGTIFRSCKTNNWHFKYNNTTSFQVPFYCDT